MSTEFEAALPPQISVDKFIRTTLTAVQMNPDLLQADRKTLLGTCMKAAQDGLMLDGREAAPVIVVKVTHNKTNKIEKPASDNITDSL